MMNPARKLRIELPLLALLLVGSAAVAQAPSARHCATEAALGRYPAGCPQPRSRLGSRQGQAASPVAPRSPRTVNLQSGPRAAASRPTQSNGQRPRTGQPVSPQYAFSLPPGAGAIGVGAPRNCLVSTTEYFGRMEEIYCRTPRGRWYLNQWPSLGRFRDPNVAMQLGAFSSADAALDAWLVLGRRFDLGEAWPFISEVRNTTGSVFRLRASLGEADLAATCRRLTGAGQACVIVYP